MNRRIVRTPHIIFWLFNFHFFLVFFRPLFTKLIPLKLRNNFCDAMFAQNLFFFVVTKGKWMKGSGFMEIFYLNCLSESWSLVPVYYKELKIMLFVWNQIGLRKISNWMVLKSNYRSKTGIFYKKCWNPLVISLNKVVHT